MSKGERDKAAVGISPSLIAHLQAPHPVLHDTCPCFLFPPAARWLRNEDDLGHAVGFEASPAAAFVADAVKARLQTIEAGEKAEPGAAQLPVPHTNFRHELDKALTSFCRRCRIYNCVTHAGPHVRYHYRLWYTGLP